MDVDRNILQLLDFPQGQINYKPAPEVTRAERKYKMKKKNNEAKIEKYTDSRGNTVFAVKILNLDTLNWLTMLRTTSLDVAEAWAYAIAYSVSYNID